VAQAVASGQADVGLGSQHAAMAAGLGFVPLVQERYQLVCLKSALDSPAVQALRTLLASPAWAHTLLAMHGYAPDDSGQVKAMHRLLPWWVFR
jgi:putative molybdopterin biosynthesis protein